MLLGISVRATPTSTAGAVISGAVATGAPIESTAISGVGSVVVSSVVDGQDVEQAIFSTVGSITTQAFLGTICSPTATFGCGLPEAPPNPFTSNLKPQLGPKVAAQFYRGRDNDTMIMLMNNGAPAFMPAITRAEVQYATGSVNSVDNPELFQIEANGIRIKFGASTIPRGIHQMRLIVHSLDYPDGFVWVKNFSTAIEEG